MTAREDPSPLPWEYALNDYVLTVPEPEGDMMLNSRSTSVPELMLTERERDILRLVAHGYSNVQISLELNLAEKTIRNQVCEIYAILGVNTRVLAVRWALRAGLASLSPSPLERGR